MAPLCGTCGKRPAITMYRDSRGKAQYRPLVDHEECRQCHKSRIDSVLAPACERRPDLRLQEICR